MLSTISLITVLVASALAAPTSTTTTTTPTCKNPTSQNAHFDDLVAIPGNVLNPIPTPYKGLLFQGFQFTSVLNPGSLPGLIPHSPTNFAFSGAPITLTSGSAEFTTVYTNSKIKSFDLSSLYYGCVLNAQNPATALPIACNIAVTGYAAGDNTASTVPVVSQYFSYNPSTNTGTQQMAQVTFNSDFKNLQYVLIQYTLPGGLAVAQADLFLVVDDVKYRTCST